MLDRKSVHSISLRRNAPPVSFQSRKTRQSLRPLAKTRLKKNLFPGRTCGKTMISQQFQTLSLVITLAAQSICIAQDNSTATGSPQSDLMKQVTHHHAENGDVKLHYVTLGDKKDRPLVVMLHGFPDFWFTCRNQMPELAKTHYVAAMDLRGYNKSDQPKGVDQYSMKMLMNDVIAVIKHAGYEKAVIVGNDWGGAISWNLAAYYPQHVEKLIICNLPHMKGLTRELANNPQQQKNSGYAREFQKAGAHRNLNPSMLTRIVAGQRSPSVQAEYQTAFERSDIESMLNYYKANYPRVGKGGSKAAPPPMPNIKCPTLVIHGLKDTALLASGLNDNWEWIDNELTILTLPKANHFVQQDAPERVSKAMVRWLAD